MIQEHVRNQISFIKFKIRKIDWTMQNIVIKAMLKLIGMMKDGHNDTHWNTLLLYTKREKQIKFYEWISVLQKYIYVCKSNATYVIITEALHALPQK